MKIDRRDYFAAKAMTAVMGETQETKLASFYVWIKHILVTNLQMEFLTVRRVEVDHTYKDASIRAYKYADEMLKCSH